MNKLEKARLEINALDKELSHIFKKRMEAVKNVAEYKLEHGLPIFDSTREKEVIERNSSLIEDDILRSYYVKFLGDLMDVSKSYQNRIISGMKIAYSGIEGSFAHIAAGKIFPDAEILSYPDFDAAYKAVESGECDSAILPLENSYAGEVGQVTDLLFSGPLYINGVYELSINQNLVALPDAELSDINEVVSHPHALAQCAPFIKKHGFKTTSFVNTALAAQHVKNEGNIHLAAVASEETAKLYGLKVLMPDINKSKLNTTKFAVFSRTLNSEVKKGMCSALMFTVKHEAGSLSDAINIIGTKYKFNMRTLRSRPMKGLLWQYYFYVEFEADITSETGKKMIDELSSVCDNIKIAGKFLPHVTI